MRAILRMETWRSPLRYWFPALVFLDLAVLFGRSRWWIGVWPQASAAAQIPSFYLGPVVTLASAWAAGRIGRRGFSLQVEGAARPRWQLEAVQLLGTIVWVVAAYLIGAILAAAVSFPSAGSGFLWPSYLVVGLSVIVGCASFGHLVGRWSSSRLTAPLAAGLFCFLAIAVVGNSLDLVLVVGDPDTSLSWTAIAGRCALAVAMYSIAILLPRVRSGIPTFRFPQQALRAGVAVGVLILSLVAFRAGGNLQRIRQMPAAALCTHGRPSVCLWPEDRKYLTRMAAMSDRLNALPKGLFHLPKTFYEQGLRKPSQYGVDGTPVYNGDFHIREGAMWDVGITMGIDVLRESFGNFCSVRPEDEDRRAVLAGEVGTWLTARITGGGRPSDVHGGPPGVDVEAVGRIAAGPEDEQISWITARLAAIKAITCV